MTQIKSITVKHVKGISEQVITCDLFPNKPNFIVAPNGAGKSSLAAAFRSLKKGKLKLVEADYYRGEEQADSAVSIELDDGVLLVADKDRNEIINHFNVCVINSGLYAKQIPRYVGGRSLSEARLSVPDAVIWSKVPPRAKINYSIQAVRSLYPEAIRKALANLGNLLSDSHFVEIVCSCAGYKASTKGSRYDAAIQDFLGQLIASGSTREEMLSAKLDYDRIKKVPPIVSLSDLLASELDDARQNTTILNAIQLKRFCEDNRQAIDAFLERKRYEKSRKSVDDLLSAINTTGSEIKTAEQGGSLVLRYPNRENVSNGELDILQFAGALARARFGLDKQRVLLIIDELFDYLDDGNLIIVQYYILQMIERFSQAGKELFVVILTHLDPSTLESYKFKAKHVSYFGPSGDGSIGGNMRGLLKDRSNCQKRNQDVYDEISSVYLHYSVTPVVGDPTREYLKNKGFPPELIDPPAFIENMRIELSSYINGCKYDAAKVCCALRVGVEQYAYRLLCKDNDKREFLEIRKTLDRLNYVEGKCGCIPEIFFLLSSLYNGCMHLSAPDEERLVIRKLDNAAIRSMVTQVAKTACIC